MQSEIEAVLELQPLWVARAPSDEMSLRGLYVRGDVADFVKAYRGAIAGRLLCEPDDVEIEGKDSTGYFSRVPWVRIANRLLSPSPRDGWYATYLFAEDGSEASLSLNQGTQVWDGIGMRSRPEASIRARSNWARDRLTNEIAARPRLDAAISLGSGDKARAYEAGNVVAYRYPRGAVPADAALASDLLDMTELLQVVYRAEAQTPAPGDPAPEVLDAECAAQEIAGRSVPSRAGFRPNAKQRKAIELRAMNLASAHFAEAGGAVKDVSANHPYDLEVTLSSGDVLSVEVKGTAVDGDEILLTRGEVEHHRVAYPANALVIASGITLEGPPDAPEATGGTLRVLRPWAVDSGELAPLSYRYVPVAS
jgi:hypothetical protein